MGTLSFAFVCGLMVLLAWFPGCSKSDAARAPGPLRVVVTVPPLAGLVKPLLPEGAMLTVLMPPGRSEHGYEFTPSDIATVGNADIVVYVGAGLEGGLEDFLKKHPAGSRRRDVSFMAAAGIATNHREDEHDHADHHHGVDPHLWLDPSLCQKLAEAVAPVLIEAAAATGGTSIKVKSSLEALTADLAAIDGEYKTRLAPFKGRSIVTHHNAWARLTDRYGLKVAAVMRDIDEGEMTPEAVAATVDAIRKQGVKAVFVEPQFDRTAAERIAEAAGVKVFELDPLGDGDWFKMMRGNLESLVKALGE